MVSKVLDLHRNSHQNYGNRPLSRPVRGPLKRLVEIWFTFIILVQSRLINKTVWILFMFVLIYSPIGSIYYLIHYSNLISYHSENICHSGNFQHPSCTLMHFQKTPSEWNDQRYLTIIVRFQRSPSDWYQRAVFYWIFGENL